MSQPSASCTRGNQCRRKNARRSGIQNSLLVICASENLHQCHHLRCQRAPAGEAPWGARLLPFFYQDLQSDPNPCRESGSHCIRASSLEIRLQLPSGERSFQVFTNFLCEKVVDLAMSGNSRGLLLAAVHEHGVLSAFSKQLTPVLLQMANQNFSVHSDVIGNASRMTSRPARSSSAS